MPKLLMPKKPLPSLFLLLLCLALVAGCGDRETPATSSAPALDTADIPAPPDDSGEWEYHPERGWFRFEEVSGFGFDVAELQGRVVIAAVYVDSPAFNAGIRRAIVMEVEGQRIETPADVGAAIAGKDAITLTLGTTEGVQEFSLEAATFVRPIFHTDQQPETAEPSSEDATPPATPAE